jgi:hypothetical protein
MSISNRDRVGRALELLNEGLKPFITRELEIQATFPNDVPDYVIRTVTENCRTLRFDNSSGFEEE